MLMKKITDGPKMISGADMRWFFFFIMGWLVNGLAINVCILFHAPVEFLDSGWGRLVGPVSTMAGGVLTVCFEGLYLRYGQMKNNDNNNG